VVSETPESLILGSGAQLALLDVDQAGLPAAAYELGEQAARFTAERIFSTNPRLYRAIAALLARSLPYREISEICGVSVNTVCAVSLREGVPIETIRERIGRLAMDVAMLTMEAIRDLLADPDWRKVASARDLAIIHGIAFQNAQLALGGATSRMELGAAAPAPSHDDYLRYVRNVTGSSGEIPAQKEAMRALVEVQATPAATTPPTPNT
jgi:hypothetical protein